MIYFKKRTSLLTHPNDIEIAIFKGLEESDYTTKSTTDVHNAFIYYNVIVSIND